VRDETVVTTHWRQFRALCPSCRIYLAGTARDRPRFAGLLAAGHPASHDDRFFVTDITDRASEE
jgi:hypothetical protein